MEAGLSGRRWANFDENKWKMVINRKVQEYGLAKWRNGIESKVSLGLYAIKPQLKMEFFFDGIWASTMLFRARSNSMEINDRTYRFNEGRIRKCVGMGLLMGLLRPLFTL